MQTYHSSRSRTPVRVESALDVESLDNLFRGDSCALIVRQFAPRRVCDHLAAHVQNALTVSPYTHETYENGEIKHQYLGVDRVGVPFNSTLTRGDAVAARETYYREALPAIRRLRSACAPDVSPIDRFRLELDELWPGGARVASFEGKSMFVGIVRVMQPAASEGSELYPHFDALPSDVWDFDGQFAANIFVKVPPRGGELEIWDVPPLEPGATLRPDWRETGGPPLMINPEVGDLIVFNSRKPHAVRRFDGSVRISVQTFLGVRKSDPVLLWN